MGQRVWTLDDWNDIIQRVNELSQDPDEGCDPLDELEEVEAPHIWSIDDVTEVQDRLTEICDENAFDAELRLWTQEIVDELEEAIGKGWCNCENPCIDDCSNATEDGVTITSCGTYTQSGCVCWPWDIGNYDPSCLQAAYEAGWQAASNTYQWADAQSNYCKYKKEVEDLEKKLEALQEQLEALEKARDETCKHKGPACDRAKQRVEKKQQKVDETQAKLDMAKTNRDFYKGEADAHGPAADAAAAESMAQAAACTCEDQGYSFLPNAGTAPWPETDCEDLGPKCLGMRADRCAVWGWRVRVRYHGGGPNDWVLALWGGYTHTGQPYLTYAHHCVGLARHCCFSSGPDCCSPEYFPECVSCSVTFDIELIQLTPTTTEEGETCCE